MNCGRALYMVRFPSMQFSAEKARLIRFPLERKGFPQKTISQWSTSKQWLSDSRKQILANIITIASNFKVKTDRQIFPLFQATPFFKILSSAMMQAAGKFKSQYVKLKNRQQQPPQAWQTRLLGSATAPKRDLFSSSFAGVVFQVNVSGSSSSIESS